jgi:Zn-dependent protease with chaperone function
MAVAVRALISIMMLAGFYVLAFVQLVLGLALAIWVASVTTGVIGAKIGAAVFLATVWAVGRGTWKALRADGAGPHGLPLDERDAPKLWEMVRELSDVVGTRMPDEIYLLPEVNAAVSERSRLMGLIPGRRYMYIGMPLLQRFTVAQLRSVLAHELGHYSGRHTRFAGISYRGRLALQRTISQISTVNIAGWVFRGYGRLFILVQNSVSRRQELEADLASVRVAGRAAAASALIQVEVLGTAFDDYMGRYVLPGIEAGYVPEDLFTGFAELLRVRAEEISALHATQRDDGGSSRWDTHPPTSTRLAAMMAVPESAADIDAGPARLLITDAAAAGRALQARLLPAAEFVALPWEEFLAATSGAGLQTNVNAILRAVSGAVNQPVPHAGAVLDLIEAGRIGEIAARILPDVPEPDGRKRFAEPLALLLSMARRQRRRGARPHRDCRAGDRPGDPSRSAAAACQQRHRREDRQARPAGGQRHTGRGLRRHHYDEGRRETDRRAGPQQRPAAHAGHAAVQDRHGPVPDERLAGGG